MSIKLSFKPGTMLNNDQYDYDLYNYYCECEYYCNCDGYMTEEARQDLKKYKEFVAIAPIKYEATKKWIEETQWQFQRLEITTKTHTSPPLTVHLNKFNINNLYFIFTYTIFTVFFYLFRKYKVILSLIMRWCHLNPCITTTVLMTIATSIPIALLNASLDSQTVTKEYMASL